VLGKIFSQFKRNLDDLDRIHQVTMRHVELIRQDAQETPRQGTKSRRKPAVRKK